MKFRKGDQVRVVDPRHGLVGNIFTIKGSAIASDPEDKAIYSFEGTGVSLFERRLELVPDYPNPPHKHAELIKAWADGAVIEFKERGIWREATRPCWAPSFEYRIQPQQEPVLLEEECERIEAEMRKLADELAELKSKRE